MYINIHIYIYVYKTKYTCVFIYSDIQALNMHIYEIYIYIIYIHALSRFSNPLYYLISNFPTTNGHPFPPFFLRWILMEHPQISPMATRACVSSCKETTVETVGGKRHGFGGTPVGFVGFGFGGGGFLGWFVEEVSDEKWQKRGPQSCLVGYFWEDEILPNYVGNISFILLNKSDGELFSLANISYSHRSYVETTR